MEFLPNGFTLEVPAGAFPLSTDSMVLSHFVRLRTNARVLDLGSGCGTLGMLLCAQNEGCTITGLEIDETAHLAALENIRRNALSAWKVYAQTSGRYLRGFLPALLICASPTRPIFPAARQARTPPLPGGRIFALSGS